MTRRICIVLTTRGNYAKTKSAMRALQARDDVTLQLVVGGALLERGYGDFEQHIAAEGFRPDALLRYPSEGKTPQSIAHASGVCTSEASSIFAERNGG